MRRRSNLILTKTKKRDRIWRQLDATGIISHLHVAFIKGEQLRRINAVEVLK